MLSPNIVYYLSIHVTETGGAFGSIKPLTGSLHYTLEAAAGGGSVLYARSSDYFNQFED